MTSGEWARCVEQLRGAWPGRLRADAWSSTWFRELQSYEFQAVAWAVVQVIRRPQEHPPSLGQFLEAVQIEERRRGLSQPTAEPEEDRAALWQELNPGKDPPPPLEREEAIRRIRAMGFQPPLLEGSA